MKIIEHIWTPEINSTLRYKILNYSNGIFEVEFMGCFDKDGKKHDYNYKEHFDVSTRLVKRMKIKDGFVTGYSEDMKTTFGTFKLCNS